MSARYKTKVSHELIEAWDVTLLPDGVRIVEIGPLDPNSHDLWHIVTFDDDGAPEELNGRMVTPLWQVDADGKVTIAGRDIDP